MSFDSESDHKRYSRYAWQVFYVTLGTALAVTDLQPDVIVVVRTKATISRHVFDFRVLKEIGIAVSK